MIRSDLGGKIFGDEEMINKVPMINRFILIYSAIVLVFYELLLIAPFLTFLSKTPVYHLSAYLGFLGAILVVLDMFTNRGIWRGWKCFLLYGICVMAALGSIRTITYGIHDNAYDLCWVGIQFALIYSSAYRLSEKTRKRYFNTLFAIVVGIWFIACCVSVGQYILQIGFRYISNPMSDNPELCRQGFWEHRLFGVFTGLDYAVYMSLMLSIWSLYYVFSEKRKGIKAALCFGILVFVIHMILSGSRSVQVSLYLFVFFFTLLIVRNKLPNRSYKTLLMKVSAGLLAVVLCFGGFSILKFGLQYLPGLVDYSGSFVQEDELPEESDPDNILDRESLEEDYSNNRFGIWKDYISLYKEIGLIGLSLSNYNDYIKDHHPELYIVTHFEEDFKDSVKQDIVYESHNNYLFVFVSTGLIGFALFLAFFISCMVKVLRFIYEHQEVPLHVISLLGIVCIGLVQALFMNSVFLKINAPSFFFWAALGALMETVIQKRKKTEETIVEETNTKEMR